MAVGLDQGLGAAAFRLAACMAVRTHGQWSLGVAAAAWVVAGGCPEGRQWRWMTAAIVWPGGTARHSRMVCRTQHMRPGTLLGIAYRYN